MLPISTLFGIFNGCLILISTFAFILIFVIVYKYHRALRDISFLLTCNTCLSGLLTCITICLMTSSNLFNGFLIVDLKFSCIWGLLYDIFECSLYHSYYLQSFYRLCRVVFYKKRSLRCYSLYLILILIEWLLIFLLLLPPYFLNWYSRLPTEKYCLIPYTSVGPEVYHIIVLYTIPLICITSNYVWITIFIRDSSRTTSIRLTIQQRQRNQRDLTVIKRIIILISILILLRFPTIIFMIYGIINGDLFPLTYPIVGLITAICLIVIALINIYITPQLRRTILNFFNYQNNRIHVQTVQINAANIQINNETTLPRTN
jgi:hypothetical protein